MTGPIINGREWFDREHGFNLYPTTDVKREHDRRLRTQGPPSDAALVGDLQVIGGEIRSQHVQGNPDSVPERGQTLIVDFEDTEGGQSELHLAYQAGRSAGWTNPVLHPSTALQSADGYTWGNPQEIVDFEFI